MNAAAAPVASGARMLEEMGQQPQVLERLLARRPELHTAIATACPYPLRGIVLVARGSSDHAALFGRYLLELIIARPVTLAAPSLWTRYKLEQDLAGYLAIGLSQSGQTKEIATTLERMGKHGAATVAITNHADSPLAQAADLVLELGSGPELAVPATKTFTAQLAMLAFVGEALGAPRWSGDWQAAVDAQREVLLDLEATVEAAQLIARSRSTVHLSRGYALAVAHESALKAVECTGIPSQGYSAPDFLHGPLAVAVSDVAVVAYGAPGPTYADVELAARKARDAGAPVIGVGLTKGMDLSVPVPAQVPEPLAPLVLVIRGQQLAYRAAVELGRNPDTPIGLTKVTQTS